MNAVFFGSVVRNRRLLLLFVSVLVLSILLVITPSSAPSPVNSEYPYTPHTEPAPIQKSDSVFLEDLTWIEVRDALATGYTSIIVPTGGIEQNGPYVTLNKHDKIVKRVSELAARKLGKTLVAPVVSFVPEGEISPPQGHMKFPGTLSTSPETFRALLSDIVRSLNQHGFTDIYLIGDSGNSQDSLAQVAQEARELLSKPGHVHYLPSFYGGYHQVNELLKNHGVSEKAESFHDSLSFTLQLVAIDPQAVRLDERRVKGLAVTGGFTIDSDEASELGELILSSRANWLTEEIRRLREK